MAQTVPVFLCLYFSSNPARPPGRAWTVSRIYVPAGVCLLSPRPLRIAEPDKPAGLCFHLVPFLEPQRLTADCLPKTLPLYLGDYFYPPTRPFSGVPLSLRDIPLRGTEFLAAPSPGGCAVVMALCGCRQPAKRWSRQWARGPVPLLAMPQ